MNVLIGAGIALAGAFLVEWYRTRVQRRHLVRALLTEIKYFPMYSIPPPSTAVQIDDVVADLAALLEHPETGIRTTVYESNLDEIGLLGVRQIESLAEFHAYLNLVSATLDNVDARFVEGIDHAGSERSVHRLEIRQARQILGRDQDFTFENKNYFHWNVDRIQFLLLLFDVIDRTTDPEVRNAIRLWGVLADLELVRREALEELGAGERDILSL